MTGSLSFELALLERMPGEYRAAVLGEIGLTETEARRIRQECELSIPKQLNSDLATYTALLGAEVLHNLPDYKAPEMVDGATAHYFLLTLWPHLFWVVHRRPNGMCWGVGFQNQALLGFEQLDPSVIRAGLWTRIAVERLADSHELYDGWDEEAVVRYAFGSDRYEGRFFFGLLQDWRKAR